jgi:amino acid transporter
LSRIAPDLTSGNRGFFVALAVVAAAVIWNLFGSKSVSTGSIGLGVLLLSPFAVLVASAIHHHSVAPAVHATAGADLLGGILVAMWNFMGWDNAANIGGEVKEAQRNYPRAMVITAVLDIITYVVPIAAMWYAHVPVSAWETGAWPELARTVGGSALAIGIVAGGMIMGGGMFNSLTMSYTRLPFVLAEDGFLPNAFTKLNRFGTPWVSLLVCAVGWGLALRIGFEHLVQIDILLYGSALMLEFIAFAMLRFREPEMERPYRAPGGKLAAILLGVGPLVLLVLALVHSESERIAGMPALAFGLLIIAAGLALFPALNYYRRRTTE